MYAVSSNIRLLFFYLSSKLYRVCSRRSEKYKLQLVSYFIDSLYFVSFGRYTSIPKLHKSILLPNFFDSPPFARVEAVEIIVAKRETVISLIDRCRFPGFRFQFSEKLFCSFLGHPALYFMKTNLKPP